MLLPTLYYLCFILYYFITSYIINIKIYRDKKVTEYRPWPVQDTQRADSKLWTFADPLYEAGVIFTF